MGDFRRLKVWQLSTRLVVELYRLTGRFPRTEMFGLTAQCRRAAVSIVSNIAEGSGRGTPAEFRRFVLMARGSLHEVRAQLHVARQLEFLSASEHDPLEHRIDEISRMLYALARNRAPPSSN
jgi:four helix bundle protein